MEFKYIIITRVMLDSLLIHMREDLKKNRLNSHIAIGYEKKYMELKGCNQNKQIGKP